MLMPHAGPFPPFGVGNVDPASAGLHRFGGGDTYGITYTCSGGFFDFGHVRDTLDQTRYHFHRFTAGGMNTVGATYRAIYRGAAVSISSVIPASEVLETAASIAHDESVWHEIETWFGCGAEHITRPFRRKTSRRTFSGPGWRGKLLLLVTLSML